MSRGRSPPIPHLNLSRQLSPTPLGAWARRGGAVAHFFRNPVCHRSQEGSWMSCDVVGKMGNSRVSRESCTSGWWFEMTWHGASHFSSFARVGTTSWEHASCLTSRATIYRHVSSPSTFGERLIRRGKYKAGRCPPLSASHHYLEHQPETPEQAPTQQMLPEPPCLFRRQYLH